MPNTYLITTATGRQGTSTARLLLAQGAQVHALVRDLTSPASLTLKSLGATLFKGGFDDVPAITAAIQGVTGVFLNTFPNFADPNGEARDAETLTDALEDWSTLKGEFPFLAQYYASKAGVERVVRTSGFTYTILRPGWLNHNYIGAGVEYHFPEYAKERVLTVSSPRGWRMEHLDADDVGQFAAAALLDPGRFAGKELDLVNELLTFEEIAAHLGEALGAEVKVKYRTAEETAEARKALPTIERQLWGPTTAPGDGSKLAEYGFRLTTLKEFLEREKSAIRKTVGIEG
ncbi:NAD dependent epimerase/dehydratase [Mycena olivaceomarginata]|nr:NAD dependent epimerase/dehydratase [Mycena olivaceomarginata]